ncbi:hypothetical protein SANTM175S_03458 [Streptomyces antimycoticus]
MLIQRPLQGHGVFGYDPNAKRKAFERLLDDCRAGLVHEIIVFDVTRFSDENQGMQSLSS